MLINVTLSMKWTQLKKYKLPTLKDIEYPNSPIAIKKMKSVIKNLSKKKISSANGFISQFFQTIKEETTPGSYKVFQKTGNNFVPQGTKLPLFESQGKGKWFRIKLHPLLRWLFYFWEKGPCLALSPGRGTPKVTMWPDLPLRTGRSDPPSFYKAKCASSFPSLSGSDIVCMI